MSTNKLVLKPWATFVGMVLFLLVQCTPSGVSNTQQTVTEIELSSTPTFEIQQDITPTLEAHLTLVSSDTSTPVATLPTQQDEEHSNHTITPTSEHSLKNWFVQVPNAFLVLTSSQFSLLNSDLSRSLLIINPDGEQQSLDELNLDAYGPSWSPSCSQIAFTQSHGVENGVELSNIALIDLVDNLVVELTSLSGEESSPAWSPSGDQIAFSYFDGQSSQIYIYTLETGDLVQLTHGGWAQSPDWSPDGNRIVFSSRDDNAQHSTIFVIDIDGSNQEPLINTYWGSGTFEDPERYGATDPTWSPDGYWIAFKVRESMGFPEQEVDKIYVMRSDGTLLHRLTAGNPYNEDSNDSNFYYVSEGEPTWSPNGQEILYTRYNEPTELCIADVATGETECIPPSNGNTWSSADWCSQVE